LIIDYVRAPSTTVKYKAVKSCGQTIMDDRCIVFYSVTDSRLGRRHTIRTIYICCIAPPFNTHSIKSGYTHSPHPSSALRSLESRSGNKITYVCVPYTRFITAMHKGARLSEPCPCAVWLQVNSLVRNTFRMVRPFFFRKRCPFVSNRSAKRYASQRNGQGLF